MNGKMSMQAEREVPLLVQRKPVATLNEYTGKPVMKSAHWAYESAAGGFPSVRPPRVAAHEIPPGGGMKAARCAAYSAFTGVKDEFANSRFVDDYLIMPERYNFQCSRYRRRISDRISFFTRSSDDKSAHRVSRCDDLNAI